VRRRKTFTILVMLLVCMMAAALLECQVHAESSMDEHAAQHEHAAPRGNHRHPSMSLTGHMACLIAVLPTVMFLVWFAIAWLHVSFWCVRVTPHALLPFIPPRTAAP
jgi:uncharacterized membrane protein